MRRGRNSPSVFDTLFLHDLILSTFFHTRHTGSEHILSLEQLLSSILPPLRVAPCASATTAGAVQDLPRGFDLLEWPGVDLAVRARMSQLCLQHPDTCIAYAPGETSCNCNRHRLQQAETVLFECIGFASVSNMQQSRAAPHITAALMLMAMMAQVFAWKWPCVSSCRIAGTLSTLIQSEAEANALFMALVLAPVNTVLKQLTKHNALYAPNGVKMAFEVVPDFKLRKGVCTECHQCASGLELLMQLLI